MAYSPPKPHALSRINDISKRNYLDKDNDFDGCDEDDEVEDIAVERYSIDPLSYLDQYKQINFDKRLDRTQNSQSNLSRGLSTKINQYILSAIADDDLASNDTVEATTTPTGIQETKSSATSAKIQDAPSVETLENKLQYLVVSSKSTSYMVDDQTPEKHRENPANELSPEHQSSALSPRLRSQSLIISYVQSTDVMMTTYQQLVDAHLQADSHLQDQRNLLRKVLLDTETYKISLQDRIKSIQEELVSMEKKLSDKRIESQLHLNRIEKSKRGLLRRCKRLEDQISSSQETMSDDYSAKVAELTDLQRQLGMIDNDWKQISIAMATAEAEYTTHDDQLRRQISETEAELVAFLSKIDKGKLHLADSLDSAQTASSTSKANLDRFYEDVCREYQTQLDVILVELAGLSADLNQRNQLEEQQLHLSTDLQTIKQLYAEHQHGLSARQAHEHQALLEVVSSLKEEVHEADIVSLTLSKPESLPRLPVSLSGRSTPRVSMATPRLQVIPEDMEITGCDDQSITNVPAIPTKKRSLRDISSMAGEENASAEEDSFDDSAYLPAPHAAAMRGDLTRLMIFHKATASLLTSLDEYQRTPLFYAMTNGSLANVKYLLDLYPSLVSQVDIHGESVCHAAAAAGSHECLGYLLIICSSISSMIVSEYVNLRNKAGMTAAHLAQNSQCLEILYHYQADLSSLDYDGRNPLFIACALNRVSSAECLIHYLDLDTESIMLRDKRGDTPLHAAACNGSIDCLLLLLQFAIDPTISDEHGYKAVELAIKNRHQECQRLLTEYTMHYYSHSNFDSILFLAALEGHKKIKRDMRRNLHLNEEEYHILHPVISSSNSRASSRNNSNAEMSKRRRNDSSMSSHNQSRLKNISLFSLKSNQTMRMQRWGAWISYEDSKSKRRYWFNHETHQGQWEIPSEVRIVEDKISEHVSTDSSSGTMMKMSMRLRKLGDWIQYSTGNGQTFYYNERTGDFQWKNPYSQSTSTSPRDMTVATTIEDVGLVKEQQQMPIVKTPSNKYGDWKPFMDPASGFVFWYNEKTNVSQWDCPDEVKQLSMRQAMDNQQSSTSPSQADEAMDCSDAHSTVSARSSIMESMGHDVAQVVNTNDDLGI
jgi:ankyrin repeat protein